MSKRIITINRMYGSGGRVLGKALAEKLGYAFYDKELIELAGKEKQIPFHELAKVDEKKPHQWRFSGDHDVCHAIFVRHITRPAARALFFSDGTQTGAPASEYLCVSGGRPSLCR